MIFFIRFLWFSNVFFVLAFLVHLEPRIGRISFWVMFADVDKEFQDHVDHNSNDSNGPMTGQLIIQWSNWDIIIEWDQEWDNLENAFGSPKNRLFCRTVINLTILIFFFVKGVTIAYS